MKALLRQQPLSAQTLSADSFAFYFALSEQTHGSLHATQFDSDITLTALNCDIANIFARYICVFNQRAHQIARTKLLLFAGLQDNAVVFWLNNAILVEA